MHVHVFEVPVDPVEYGMVWASNAKREGNDGDSRAIVAKVG